MAVLLIICQLPTIALASTVSFSYGTSSAAPANVNSTNTACKIGYDSNGNIYFLINLGSFVTANVNIDDSAGNVLGTSNALFSNGQYNNVWMKTNFVGTQGSSYKINFNGYISGVITITAQVPSSPTGLQVTGSGTNAALSWGPVANATSYNIYDNSNEIKTGITSTSYTVTNLVPGSVHSFAVQSTGAGGSSDLSATVAYTVPNYPSAPTGLTVSAGTTSSGTISWSANPTSDTVSSYKVYVDGTAIGSTTGTSYRFSNLSSGNHAFQVSAVNEIGEGPKSSSVGYTVVNPPLAPAVSVQDITTNSATATWNSVISATSYDISINGSFLVNITGTSYALTNLLQGETYTVSVVAKNSAGSSGPGSYTFTVTPLPNPPTGLQATNITTTSLDLSWNSVTGAITYILDQNGDVLAQTTDNFYHVTGLTPNTTYEYKVAVVTGDGQSNYSNAISATTLGLPPATPSGLSYDNLAGTSFRVYWLSQTDATQYQVYLNGELVSTVDQPTLFNPSYTFTGLSMAQSYNVSIVALNQWGSSTASAPLTVVTLNLPSAPTGLQATDITTDSFVLSWAANPQADQVTGYNIYVNGTQYGSKITSNSANMTGFTPGTSYTIQVTAINSQGEGMDSLPITITTLKDTIPDQVTGLQVTNITASSAAVSWSPTTTTLLDYYEVYDTLSDSILAKPTTNSVNLTGLKSTTRYNIEVRAHNRDGFGSYSTPVSFQTAQIKLTGGITVSGIINTIPAAAKPVGGVVAFLMAVSTVFWTAIKFKFLKF